MWFGKMVGISRYLFRSQNAPTFDDYIDHIMTLTLGGDITLQAQLLAGPRSQLEVITGENDPDKSYRSCGIICLTDYARSAHAAGEPCPPLWRTYEFIHYYFGFIVAFPHTHPGQLQCVLFSHCRLHPTFVIFFRTASHYS